MNLFIFEKVFLCLAFLKMKPCYNTFMKILLLEDDTNIGYGIKRYLKANHDVVVTTSVQEAKNLEPFVFDLLIVDVNLPDGSGFEWVKAVRHYDQTPVIFF